MKKQMVLILTVLLAISMTLPLYSQGTKEAAVDTSQYVYETKGPTGEAPTDYSKVVLTAAEKDAVKKTNYKVAILMHESSDMPVRTPTSSARILKPPLPSTRTSSSRSCSTLSAGRWH